MIQLDGVGDMSADQCVNVSVLSGVGQPDIGTDGWIAPGQTFDRDVSASVGTGRGYIEDGVLRAGPFDVSIPVAILQVFFQLEVRDAMIEARIEPDGSLIGMIGGAVPNEKILDVARTADRMQATQIADLLEPALRGLADMEPDERGRCSAVSATMLFEGTPAFLYEDTEEFGAIGASDDPRRERRGSDDGR